MLIFCLAVLRCVSSHMLLSRFEETIDFAHQFQKLLRILRNGPWRVEQQELCQRASNFRQRRTLNT